MRDVTVDEAFREACLALGEAVVRERLLTAELARLEAEDRGERAPESSTTG